MKSVYVNGIMVTMYYVNGFSKKISLLCNIHTCYVIFKLQIVLYREEELLANDCDMCILHSILSKIPDDLPYEQLIVKAGELYDQHSPKELAHEAILEKIRQQKYVITSKSHKV